MFDLVKVCIYIFLLVFFQPNLFEYPDGHKAPVPGCLTRSVDTQTPSQSEFAVLSLANDPVVDANDGRCSSVASSDADDSRPQSASPTFTGRSRSTMPHEL